MFSRLQDISTIFEKKHPLGRSENAAQAMDAHFPRIPHNLRRSSGQRLVGLQVGHGAHLTLLHVISCHISSWRIKTRETLYMLLLYYNFHIILTAIHCILKIIKVCTCLYNFIIVSYMYIL